MADAHAFLDHAEPKVGNKVQAAPTEVKVWFTQKLVIAFSELQVFDAAGKENDAPCTVAPAGEKREGVALAATSTGAVTLWMEGSRVRTRALDASGCPARRARRGDSPRQRGADHL